MVRIEAYDVVVSTFVYIFFIITMIFIFLYLFIILFFFLQKDSNNEHLDKMVKQHSCMLDLCGSMKGCAIAQGRHLFMEGDLKFKDNNSKVIIKLNIFTLTPNKK